MLALDKVDKGDKNEYVQYMYLVKLKFFPLFGFSYDDHRLVPSIILSTSSCKMIYFMINSLSSFNKIFKDPYFVYQ